MVKKKITPIKDRLVVKTIKGDDEVRGIIVPEEAKEKETRGEVTEIGPLVEEVKVGDTVIFGTYSGTELTIDGVDYRVMREEEIFAIL